MGALRNKMIDAMKQGRFSLRTEEADLGARGPWRFRPVRLPVRLAQG